MGVMTESTTIWFSLPMLYSTWAIDGMMNRSKCVTTPPEGERIRASRPGGLGSPTYSASARSLVRWTFA